MDKLRMKSLDAVEGNVAKIAALFPHCVTERKGKDGTAELAIDFDKLRAELSTDALDSGEERYQFTWPDKRAASRLANTPTDKTLRPDVNASVDFWNTKNLYIEGDNLDVLKVLRENYLGKVKMIYIDPPYNTGNDFVYNDEFAISQDEFDERAGFIDEDGNRVLAPMQRNTESNGRFHTDWLNMLYPRLKVARDLLSDDGAIFISIDDNEIENLAKICDEIFGNRNFISRLTIVVKPEGRRYGAFAKCHENCLIYAKNIELINFNEIEVEGASYQYYDAEGGYNLKGLRNRNVKAFNSLNRPNLRYPFYVDLENISQEGLCPVTTIKTDGWTKVEASVVDGLKSVWRWGKDTAQARINQLVAFRGPDGNIRIYQKERKLSQTPKTIWNDTKYISNKGTKEVEELMGKGIFDFPKPVSLLQNMVFIGMNDEDLLLDFFSGSATTAHAVMKLNAEDGGHRKFIMVQLPEVTDEKSEARKAGYETICQIGEERIRRAGKKVKEEVGLHGQDLDTGFRVLKLDSSNMEDAFYTPEDFNEAHLFNTVDNVKSDRTPLDLLFQVMSELDIELSAKIEEKEVNGKKVFFVDDTYLIATFDTEVNESTVTEIAKMRPQYFVMRDSSAANDNVLDNFEQIFRHYSPDTIRKIL
ncbi:site-specific DNA-methyltransferase [uncultured Duncaniella sp.]|uniref:site-specific DNA-methyltransferase n=1 Tax=uncultured Duncaniella sp. TaxID=2768039 RepID=UPI0026133862|nr:site-specific DNA-methyltransferase [uncultured Duncaniella sp.]